MANLKIGSNDPKVKEVQEGLESLGYNIGKTGADGVFGKNTQAGVIEFQKENDLTPDGIVGPKTSAKLNELLSAKATTTGTGGNANAGANANKDPAPKTNPVEPAAPAEPENAPGTVNAAPTLTDSIPDSYYTAMDTIAQFMTTHPGEYSSVYGDKVVEWANKYENRDPFSYNMNEDALYQQYKDQYIQLGQLASEDVMGQAAAMTGGYANSYAQSVSQQAYNQYLSQLNDVALDLHDRAYNIYNQEGQDMLNMYNMYMGLEEQERANYQTNLSNWYDQLGMMKDNAESIWNKGVDAYTSNWNQYTYEDTKATNAKTNNYSNLRDTIASTGIIPSAEELEAAGMTEWEAKSIAEGYNSNKSDSKQSELKNLIMGYGYNPTDDELKAAGMTRAQANGYLNTYKENATTKTSTSSNGTNAGGTDYKEMDLEKVRKDFDRCTTVEEVNDLADLYRAEGYNEESVKILARSAAKRIAGDDGKPAGDDNKTGGNLWDWFTNLF